MPKIKSETEQEVGLQMAPMINVMLVMLSVFVATSSVAQKEHQLGVKVPGKAGAPNEGPREVPINIKITTEGDVLYNGSLYDSSESKDLPQLTAKLTDVMSKFDTQPVIIRPVGNASHDRVIDVLNACSAAGVKNLSFGGGK